MQFESNLEKGILIKRYKRFLVDIQLENGEQITIHCPNTGSMKNCLYPGLTAWFSRSSNPKRKYPCTFEIMQTPAEHLIGVNTIRANQLAYEAMKKGIIKEIQGYQNIKKEVRYGCENSRIDFLLQGDDKPDCYVEVKSCTLLEQNYGYFPDAKTQRGQKHLRELIQIVTEGKRAVLLFVVQHSGIHKVAAAKHIDPEYSSLLEQANRAGVEILAYCCELSHQHIEIKASCQVIV